MLTEIKIECDILRPVGIEERRGRSDPLKSIVHVSARSHTVLFTIALKGVAPAEDGGSLEESVPTPSAEPRTVNGVPSPARAGE